MWRESVLGVACAAAAMSTFIQPSEARRRGGRSYSAGQMSGPTQPRKIVSKWSNYRPDQVCSRRFATGQHIGEEQIIANGRHELTIKNDAAAPAFVKVVSASEETLARFYVDRSTRWTLSNIPDGDYFISYVAAPVFGPDCESVIDAGEVNRFPGPKSMRVTVDAEGNQYSFVLEYTLYTVPNGNVTPRKISLAEFNSD